MPEPEAILFVDDEKLLLDGIRRQFHGVFQIHAAASGEEGLEVLAREKIAVVISDMGMPGMNGAEFLKKVHEIFPGTVRMILSGQSEIFDVISAVNDANVFRFLIKPCPRSDLEQALRAGIQQYRLIHHERLLRENTVQKCLQLVLEVMAKSNPEAFDRSKRIQKRVQEFLSGKPSNEDQEILLAAGLSLIGHALLPPDINMKIALDQPLNREEKKIYQDHLVLGGQVIGRIPGFEGVGRIIVYQGKHYDGKGDPTDAVKGTGIPLGSRLLKIFTDLDRLQESGRSPGAMLTEMQGRAGSYDPDLLAEVFKTP